MSQVLQEPEQQLSGEQEFGPLDFDQLFATKYRILLRGKAYTLRKWDLLERDGPICQGCKQTFPSDELTVQHKNGNQYDHRLSNTELMCRACNTGEQNRRRPTRTVSSYETEKKRFREAWPSRIAWEGFRHLQLEVDYEKLLDQLLDEGPVTVSEAADTITEMTKSTQQTWNQWFKRASNKKTGSFSISERQVTDGRKTRTEQFISRKRAPP